MTTKNTTANIVVLGIKTESTSSLVSRGTAIVNAMTANKGTFTSPTPSLATVSAAITTLTNAEAAFKSHVGIRADRDSAQESLIALMKQLLSYVQGLVSASPSQAESIAQEAAMSLRKAGTRHKSDLSIKQIATGAVKVVAKAAQGGRAYDWQYSADGGKTWTDVPSTTRASTTITGLTPGAMVAFRHRAITKAGPSDWSQSVSAIVS